MIILSLYFITEQSTTQKKGKKKNKNKMSFLHCIYFTVSFKYSFRSIFRGSLGWKDDNKKHTKNTTNQIIKIVLESDLELKK